MFVFFYSAVHPSSGAPSRSAKIQSRISSLGNFSESGVKNCIGTSVTVNVKMQLAVTYPGHAMQSGNETSVKIIRLFFLRVSPASIPMSNRPMSLQY